MKGIYYGLQLCFLCFYVALSFHTPREHPAYNI